MIKMEEKRNLKYIGTTLVVSGASINSIMNILVRHFDIKDFIQGFFDGFSLSIAVVGFIAFMVALIAQRRKRLRQTL